MYRNELQMQLDSKESDIEQLREKLNDLQLRMDNSSVTSLQTDETDGNIAGKVTPGVNGILLSSHRAAVSMEILHPNRDAPIGIYIYIYILYFCIISALVDMDSGE